MILPPNFAAALALLILSALCLGGWANTYKMGGKWRFELYYLDFTIGAGIIVLVLALTFGSLGYDGFTFFDDIMHAGKNQWLMAFVAGLFLNAGTLFTLAAVATGGMSIGFPVAMGTAALMGTILTRAVEPGSADGTLQFTGAALSVTAVLVAAAAYRMIAVLRHEAVARAGRAKSTKRPAPIKAIMLGSVGGILIALCPPFLNSARTSEIGLGPYGAMAFVIFATFLSTVVLSLFLMNLPVDGGPVDVFDYLKGTIGTHVRGAIGGMLWAGGWTALLLVGAGTENYHLSPGLYNAFAQGWPILAGIFGLAIWKEFRGCDGRIKILLALMFLLLAGGLGLLSMALQLPAKPA